MSLFQATFATGIVLFILGGLFFWNGSPVEKQAKASLRSPTVTFILFGTAASWFLWHIAHLGEADFGNLKHILLALFGVVAVGSFLVVKDFLAVRGLAALMLLAARPLLDAAYMEEPTSRLFLVTFVYVAIVAALYWGLCLFACVISSTGYFCGQIAPRFLAG